MKPRLGALVAAVALAAPLALAAPQAAHAAATTTATIDPSTAKYKFHGIGALSGGGGNTRLLYDYPDAQRNQILDYLFKPGYGANLQILKVEIGGDTNSTDGAEHSFEHTEGDIKCDAGYEMWLMKEARQRNPNIKLYAMAWGAPSWVSDGDDHHGFYTPKAIKYLEHFLQCAKDKGTPIDYLGGWNERYSNGWSGDHRDVAMPWYVSLRSSLNSDGYSSVQVVGGDDFGWQVAKDMRADGNTAFRDAVDVVGIHYPCHYMSDESSCEPSTEARSLLDDQHKPLWASEDGSQNLDTGALPMARAHNRGYIDAKISAQINWPLTASAYQELLFADTGLISANQPWSGAYHVGASTWVTAQTTQFTAPDWYFADSASGYLGGSRSAGLGSYVTYVAPQKDNWSTVAETVDAPAGSSQTLNLSVTGGLPGGTVHVWSTDLSDPRVVYPMSHVGDVTPDSNGKYAITLAAGHVYTITTTSTVPGTSAAQSPGTASSPTRTMLSLPYTDSLGSAPIGKEPKLFTDMNGAFQSAPCGGNRTGNCLRQTAVGTPIFWNSGTHDNPYTLAGDPHWSNYTVAADVMLEQSGSVELVGRAEAQSRNNEGLEAYHLNVSGTGAWNIQKSDKSWQLTTLPNASGTTSALRANTWYRLALTFQGSQISATLDGKLLGTTTDSSYGSGLTGLGVGGYYGAQFANYSVTAGTTTALSGTYEIINDNSHLLMDAAGAYLPSLAVNGTLIDQWHKIGDNGDPNQQWKISANGDGYYSITGINSKSLDAYMWSQTAGTQMELYTDYGQANQEWAITPYTNGTYLIENRNSGYVLEVANWSKDDGGVVDQYPANNGVNQRWQLNKIG